MVKVFEEELIVPTEEQAHHFGNRKSIVTGRGDPLVLNLVDLILLRWKTLEQIRHSTSLLLFPEKCRRLA